MLRDARLVLGKDLRIEMRSRVTTNQVTPFALLVLVLFAFAIDPGLRISGEDRTVLDIAAPGLFWITVLFAGLLALQRAFTVEAADANRDGLRLSGLDPAGIFLGKAGAVIVQLLALEVILGVGAVLLYDVTVRGILLIGATALAATAGIASAGTLYGVLAAGLRVRETLMPILLFPVLAPVLIGATQAFEAALAGSSSDGWGWAALLGVFAIVYTAVGVLSFGTLLEES
ncbi:MAG: hypothetical protein GY745_18080 [Actinomycetia bacterium]|nr:hypothetical protein [Actinomycetes bacterium]